MKKIFLKLIFIEIFIISCKSSVNQTNTRFNKENTQSRSNTISIEPFTSIPKEIDGCSCSFYASEKDKKESKYICVNDFASIAFLTLNGQLNKFALVEHKDNSNTYIYKNEEYTLKIEIIKKQPGDYEVSNIEGVIIINSKSGSKEQGFIGTCGC
jgi:hypothetical protein